MSQAEAKVARGSCADIFKASTSAAQALIRRPFVLCSHLGLLEELKEAGLRIELSFPGSSGPPPLLSHSK